MTNNLIDFIRESNRIEGINRKPTEREIEAHKVFLRLPVINTESLCDFVAAVQPKAVLRDTQGLDVRVGNHLPPLGGLLIVSALESLLDAINDGEINAYEAHQRYESLHPFTDGNGRSGRVLWLWMMEAAPLGFLHSWYYQSLSGYRHDK